MEIVWETSENIAKAQEKVEYMLNGCKCRTGCTTRRCSCRKGSRGCGPGCRCIGCGNVVSSSRCDDDELHDLEIGDLLNEESDDVSTDASEDDDADLQDDNICERDIGSIMTIVFGEDDSDTELM